MTRRLVPLRPAHALALALAAAAPIASAGPPPAGTCPTIGRGDAKGVEDAAGVPLEEGMPLSLIDVLALEKLFPPELWKYRDYFFYEGMRMEIGGCHRDYPPTAAYRKATEQNAADVRLDEKGNLRHYRAGRPFPETGIDPAASDAAMRWAWNFELRDRGAGPVGSFRIFDLPDKIGTPQTYKGSFFHVQTGHRADLPESDYKSEAGSDKLWVAGGQFDEPFDARHLAWRQLRPNDTTEDFSEPDDTFVYVPTMRKVRRAATSWVDGLYAPRYLVAGIDQAGGGVPFGSNEFGPAGSIQPNAGLSIAATENLRRGFIGLAIRPNAYVWRMLGEREVLAPLNGSTLGYPQNPDRNFGPSGLSVASDRWDVRWAVVIEGKARRAMDDVGYVRLWIDWQTGQPLYYMADRPNRLALDVGVLVHRWSADRSDYPDWPGVGRVGVFDPVAAAFLDVGNGRSGWRRESYDSVSIPVEEKKLRKMAGVDALEHGH